MCLPRIGQQDRNYGRGWLAEDNQSRRKYQGLDNQTQIAMIAAIRARKPKKDAPNMANPWLACLTWIAKIFGSLLTIMVSSSLNIEWTLAPTSGTAILLFIWRREPPKKKTDTSLKMGAGRDSVAG